MGSLTIPIRGAALVPSWFTRRTVTLDSMAEETVGHPLRERAGYDTRSTADGKGPSRSAAGRVQQQPV